MSIGTSGAKVVGFGQRIGHGAVGLGSGAAKGLDKLARDISFGADEKLGEIAGKKVADNVSYRTATTLGGGIEGALVGGGIGAVTGGAYGAADEDETFIEGAAKGALSGAGIGLIGGGASGFIHRDARLFSNASKDYRRVAEYMSKGMKPIDGAPLIPSTVYSPNLNSARLLETRGGTMTGNGFTYTL